MGGIGGGAQERPERAQDSTYRPAGVVLRLMRDGEGAVWYVWDWADSTWVLVQRIELVVKYQRQRGGGG